MSSVLGGDDVGAVAVDVVAILGFVDDPVGGRLVVGVVFVVSVGDGTAVEKSQKIMSCATTEVKYLLVVVVLDMMRILRRNQCQKGGWVWNDVSVGIALQGDGWSATCYGGFEENSMSGASIR
jgi:hypothetical protein